MFISADLVFNNVVLSHPSIPRGAPHACKPHLKPKTGNAPQTRPALPAIRRAARRGQPRRRASQPPARWSRQPHEISAGARHDAANTTAVKPASESRPPSRCRPHRRPPRRCPAPRRRRCAPKRGATAVASGGQASLVGPRRSRHAVKPAWSRGHGGQASCQSGQAGLRCHGGQASL